MNSPSQLVMDRVPKAVPSLERSGVQSIRSILFAVHDDEGLDARLQAALSIARACAAHLQLLHVVPIDAYAALDTYGGAYISGEIVEVLQDQADKVRLRLEKQLKSDDVSWNYEQTTSVILPELLDHAAFADLVVIGREPHFHEFGRTGLSLLGALICGGRGPFVIPGDGKNAFDPFGKAIVAWNGSVEAANAVRQSVGMLKLASEVRVVRYSENKEVSLKDERLLEYLSRHDVHAEIECHVSHGDIGENLLNRSLQLEVEYLVLGGYTHSRAGEFLFGGVTRSMLRECGTSLIVAH